jgi:hypothetical protein
MTPRPVPRRAPASSAGRLRTRHCTAIEHRRAHPAPARGPGPVEAPCATPRTLDRHARQAQTLRQPAGAVAAGRRRRRAVQSHCDFAPSRSWAGRGRSSSRTRWSRQQLRSRLRGSAMGRDGARTSRTSHRPQHPLVAATGPPRGCANGIARRRRRGGSVCLSASPPLLRAPIAPAGRAVRLLARRRAGHRRDVCQCEPRTFCATPGWQMPGCSRSSRCFDRSDLPTGYGADVPSGCGRPARAHVRFVAPRFRQRTATDGRRPARGARAP